MKIVTYASPDPPDSTCIGAGVVTVEIDGAFAFCYCSDVCPESHSLSRESEALAKEWAFQLGRWIVDGGSATGWDDQNRLDYVAELNLVWKAE